MKEIKRDIDSLNCVKKDMDNFKESWLQPFLTQSGKVNKRLTDKGAHQILEHLNVEEKQQLHDKLVEFYNSFELLKNANSTHQKMRGISNAITEMKLLNFQSKNNGSEIKDSVIMQGKIDYLSNKILKDDFHGFQTTINEVKEFDTHLSKLASIYEEINLFLSQTLSLEHSVALLEMPHQKYLSSLIKTSEKRRDIIKMLGDHFLELQGLFNQREEAFQKAESYSRSRVR